MVKHLTGSDIGLVSVNERNLPLFRNVKITGSTISILAHYIINKEERKWVYSYRILWCPSFSHNLRKLFICLMNILNFPSKDFAHVIRKITETRLNARICVKRLENIYLVHRLSRFCKIHLRVITHNFDCKRITNV